jgi:hypothetical protein
MEVMVEVIMVDMDTGAGVIVDMDMDMGMDMDPFMVVNMVTMVTIKRFSYSTV